MLFNYNSREYSFIVGNAILYISKEGQIEHSSILKNGHVIINHNMEPLIRTLDHALMTYSKIHGIERPQDSEDESYEMVMESEPPSSNEDNQTSGVIGKIRKKLNL